MTRLPLPAWPACIIVCCGALAQEPRVRIKPPAEAVWVGERATVVVELLAPGLFASAASFELSDAPALLLFPPAEHLVVSNEQADGASYTVQRHELSAVAQRAGEQTIPPLEVRFQYQRQSLEKEPTAAALNTEPIRFTAKLPPGAEGLGTVVSARELQVTETWKPDPGTTGAKLGDAFTRTVTLAAQGAPGMLFPPFPAGAIDGLGIYAKPPEVLDHSDRGSLHGERRETITYVDKRAGCFEIPVARMTWFDLDAKKLRAVELPARAIEVAPGPGAAGATAPSGVTAQGTDGRRSALPWLVLTATLLLALALGWSSGGRRLLRAMLMPFRPTHLQALNPSGGAPPRPADPGPRTAGRQTQRKRPRGAAPSSSPEMPALAAPPPG